MVNDVRLPYWRRSTQLTDNADQMVPPDHLSKVIFCMGYATAH